MKRERINYERPDVEIIDLRVEAGIAQSFGDPGSTPPVNTDPDDYYF